MSYQQMRLVAWFTGCVLTLLLVAAVAGLVRAAPTDSASSSLGPGHAATPDAPGGMPAAGQVPPSDVPAEMNPAEPAVAGSSDEYALPGRSTSDSGRPSSEGRAAPLLSDQPRAVVRAVPGSRGSSTQVSADGRRVQMTLTATVTRPPASVLSTYRARLTRLGLVETPSRSFGGSVSATFTNGRDVVVVTATSESDRTRYSILATLAGTRR